MVRRGGDPHTIKMNEAYPNETSFVLPADPVEAAQVGAKFWQAVGLPQVGAEVACWRHRGGLFQCQVGYVRYATTAAWTMVYGQPLGVRRFESERDGQGAPFH